MRRAKIVGTLGPSSSTVEQIARLIGAGLNVARVNMSHGTHEEHAKVIANIREASRQVGREVAILLDLQGPKIRVDKLPKNLILGDEEEWVIGQSAIVSKYPQYQSRFIPTIYDKLVSDTKVGDRILFDDGLIVAKAVGKDGDVLKIKVNVGGELKSNKGINLPDSNVSAPSFTEKDHKDLMFGLQHDIDYVAMSFVRTKKDVQQVKFLLHDMKKNVPIVSKIEKPQAIENIDEILDVTDVIMIARGDMGVELGNHLVPSTQKMLIHKCNERGIPVITATQMLESMIKNPRPTRAETTDVANAIYDGTSAIMLSGETAAGIYPVEALQMMVRIANVTEKDIDYEKRFFSHPRKANPNITDAICHASCTTAHDLNAKAIVTVTKSGTSARMLSRYRPACDIIGCTTDVKVSRQINLSWGVRPVLINEKQETFGLFEHALAVAQVKGFLETGDIAVITSGVPIGVSGTTNMIKVQMI